MLKLMSVTDKLGGSVARQSCSTQQPVVGWVWRWTKLGQAIALDRCKNQSKCKKGQVRARNGYRSARLARSISQQVPGRGRPCHFGIQHPRAHAR